MTTNHRVGLRDWRNTLLKSDDSPYVGPRPQTLTRDRGMLIGRREDLERIEKAVIHRSLVVLDGDSGVGKSSLLQNGLYGVLEDSGFAVLVNRQWKATGDPLDSRAALDRYLVDGIRRTHETLRLDVPQGLDAVSLAEGSGLYGWLDADRGDTATVLILDQFEELFRLHGERTEQIVKWVIDAGYQSSLRVILSLRTDSLHRLDPLLRGVKPYSMDRIRLEEIDREDDIRQVMRTPRQAKGNAGLAAPKKKGSRIAMSDPAVERLMVAWRAHRPKLLDLQATLYALYFRAKRRGGKRSDTRSDASSTGASVTMIEPADIAGLAAEAPGPRSRGKIPNLFAVGLREAIRLKIDLAAQASRAAKLDPYLLSGTMEAAKRIAPLLSSSDFKVPIHELELAQRALAREMRVLERSLLEEHELLTGEMADPQRPWLTRNRVAERLYRALRSSGDLLEVRPDQIEPLRGLQKKIDEQEQPPGRWNAPAGPMLYQTAMATLFEELRRVAFAIEWLETTEIARKDPDGILLLIHDRSGEALKEWADAQKEEPSAALRLLTGARGEHFVWAQGIGNLDSRAGHHEVIANVNWRDCRIQTDFRLIVFVNCDFTGSRFDRCTFEGVTFLNCILNGATFEACEIRGANDQEPVVRLASKVRQKGGKRRLAPSFTVEARSDEVRTFSLYQGADGQNRSSFFSDTAGVAAVPGGRPPDHSGELLAHFATAGDAQGPQDGRFRPGRPAKVTPTTGGVTMVGGLLHFLTVVRCSANPKTTGKGASRLSTSPQVRGGAFSFHHVSGGGLDIVEQREGRIDIHDGVLRGVSVTRDLEPSDDDSDSGNAAAVELTVNDSFVFNVYFSEGLTGSADFEKSVVVMLLNASDAARFPVQLEDCRYQCVVNTTDPQRSSEDSSELRERQGLPYFAHRPGYHSRFTLPNRALLASDLEAMDFHSRPETREAAQRSGSAPRSASRSPDAITPSTMEEGS